MAANVRSAGDGSMRERSLGNILERQTSQKPTKPFLLMRSGRLTYGEFNTACNRLAHGFADLNVSKGEVVSVMLPNCPESVLVWFATAKLGAIEAPMNTAVRGVGLAHMLTVAGSRILVIHEDFLDALAEVEHSVKDTIEIVAVVGDAAPARRRFPQWNVCALDGLRSRRVDNPDVGVTESDGLMLLFTSGTTGRSKACALSHGFALRQAELCAEHWELVAEDVMYCPFPLFHADATIFTTVPALVLGATVALGDRFSVSRFWDDIRAVGATTFDYMGATLTLLWKRDPEDDDADNSVRLAWGVPMPEFAPEFEKRFGLRLVDAYGLTEAGLPVYRRPREVCPPGSCGRPINAYDLRIVDDDGFEVPAGTTGEVVLRPREPSLIMDGYYNMPEATLAMFKDLWLHSGDIAYLDDDGFFYFVGRKKDAIRRRGENISAFEIEEVLDSHPDVLESAAIGVPSEFTEEDVKVYVVPRPGTKLSPEQVIEYCERRTAKFMVPRYVAFLEMLPKTPTQKVEKYVLKDDQLSTPVWDRETGSWVSSGRRPES
ncbi:MAG: AMP-binding protein [Gemmatimonas sp.]|nr:AMP-binding protein [Gemmatimonas sp.]